MTLVDETNMHEGVGRMFILQSKEAIHNQLLEKQTIAGEKIKELEQKKILSGAECEGSWGQYPGDADGAKGTVGSLSGTSSFRFLPFLARSLCRETALPEGHFIWMVQ